MTTIPDRGTYNFDIFFGYKFINFNLTGLIGLNDFKINRKLTRDFII